MAEPFNIFSSWARLGEVVLNSALFFVLIVVLVRLLGKRTTSQLNNFDWIINVAVGSLAASGILLRNVSTLDAIAAIIALALCQYLTTWWVNKSPFGVRVIKAKPTLLVSKGQFNEEAMTKARISEGEVRAQLRKQGYIQRSEANWVILETDGSFSIIPMQDAKKEDAELLEEVQIFDQSGG